MDLHVVKLEKDKSDVLIEKIMGCLEEEHKYWTLNDLARVCNNPKYWVEEHVELVAEEVEVEGDDPKDTKKTFYVLKEEYKF